MILMTFYNFQSYPKYTNHIFLNTRVNEDNLNFYISIFYDKWKFIIEPNMKTQKLQLLPV